MTYKHSTINGNCAICHINIHNGIPQTWEDVCKLKEAKQEAKQQGMRIRIAYRGPHAPTPNAAHTRKADAWGAAIYLRRY